MTTVEIFGGHYNIRGDHKPETILALARFVNLKMNQVAKQVGRGDGVRVAVLAALNIADDYYQTRTALERREEDTAERAADLASFIGKIDGSLK